MLIRTILFVTSVFLLCVILTARGQEVSSVNTVTINDKEAVITYDLKGDPDTDYKVELFLISDKDAKFELKLMSVRGDVGTGKFVGSTRTVTWNYSIDFPDVVTGEAYRVRIAVNKVGGGGLPWYVYAGASAVVGVAAILLTKKDNGNDQPIEKTIPTPPPRP